MKNNSAEQEQLKIMHKFTGVLSSLKGDLTAGEQWLLRFIYVGGKEDRSWYRMFQTKCVINGAYNILDTYSIYNFCIKLRLIFCISFSRDAEKHAGQHLYDQGNY